MRKALLAGLFLSGSFVGASNAAALGYCGTSGSFGACASAGFDAGYDGSGPAVGLRNLAGLAGDAGYVLAGFAMYYVGTHYAFGNGGSQEGGSTGTPGAAETSLGLASSSAGRGSRLAPLRSEKGSKAPRSGETSGKGNGPINYTLSLEGGKSGNGSLPAADFVPSAPPSSNQDVGSPGLTPTLSTTAPEPVTMALTAIGLLGLVGAGYVRRLRQS